MLPSTFGAASQQLIQSLQINNQNNNGLIGDGSYNIITSGNNNQFNITQVATPEGEDIELDKLLDVHVSKDALRNSYHSPPECHPNTRTTVRNEIGGWLDESVSERSPLLWLNGPVGVGKSVIAKTVSGFHDQIVATFFFSTSSDKSAATLFPTLAWQLARRVPDTRKHIIASLKRNSQTSQIEEQFDRLIIQPLKSITALGYRPVMVIDGADECTNEIMLVRFLRVLVQAGEAGDMPVRFIICSRPEPRIHAILRGIHNINPTTNEQKLQPRRGFVVVGLAVGLAFSLVSSLALSLALGLAFGSEAIGSTAGIPVGVTVALAVRLAGALAVDNPAASGLLVGVAVGVTAGVAVGMSVGLTTVKTIGPVGLIRLIPTFGIFQLLDHARQSGIFQLISNYQKPDFFSILITLLMLLFALLFKRHWFPSVTILGPLQDVWELYQPIRLDKDAPATFADRLTADILDTICPHPVISTIQIGFSEECKKDIARYLTDTFNGICQLGEDTTTWFKPSDISNIVEASCGQFLYASTIVKLLDDPHFYPRDILEMARRSSLPTPDLNELYKTTLKRAQDTRRNQAKEGGPDYQPEWRCVMDSLTILVFFEGNDPFLTVRKNFSVIESLLGLEKSKLNKKLCKMHSVLCIIPGESVSVHHRSFLEFLSNPRRSGEYHVAYSNAMQRTVIFMLRAGLRNGIRRFLRQFKNDDNERLKPVQDVVATYEHRFFGRSRLSPHELFQLHAISHIFLSLYWIMTFPPLSAAGYPLLTLVTLLLYPLGEFILSQAIYTFFLSCFGIIVPFFHPFLHPFFVFTVKFSFPLLLGIPLYFMVVTLAFGGYSYLKY